MRTLKSAIEEACLLELEMIPSEAQLQAQIVCSPAFEKRMADLFRHTKNGSTAVSRPRISKRLLLVAIVAALLTSLLSVQAFQQSLLDFAFKIHETYTRVTYNTPDSQTTEESETDTFVVPTPPKGYEMTRLDEGSSYTEVEYVNASDKYLIYNRYKTAGSNVSLDTEGTQVKAVDVYGHQGLFFKNKGIYTIHWSDGKYGYILFGDCSIFVFFDFLESLYS